MDRRSQKTRAAIFAAFDRLIQKNAYSDISVQDIIDEANVGHSTFYEHFSTKDELLRQKCTDLFEHIFALDFDRIDVLGGGDCREACYCVVVEYVVSVFYKLTKRNRMFLQNQTVKSRTAKSLSKKYYVYTKVKIYFRDLRMTHLLAAFMASKWIKCRFLLLAAF